MTQSIGRITWINGPVMRAEGSRQVTMGEMVELGEEHLVGEVIGLKGNTMTIQVYEETSGISPGMAVYGTGLPLSVELAPGLIRGIFDGIQRPLTVMERFKGSFIGRGIQLTPLYRGTKWSFTPILEKGTHVFGGSVLGTVPETPMILHKVMVPPWISGTILDIATKGEYLIEEPIAVIKTESGEQSISMLRRWPVRTPRPVKARLEKNVPLMTGQRILDTFFPLVKGGTAAIPGGFGTGKTITQHQVAKWSVEEVVV
jgi:V/A-type H+-transporting ATPase subunit A